MDPEDSEPRLLTHLAGVDPTTVPRILGLEADATPPAVAFWATALRETFEETGVLLARTVEGHKESSVVGAGDGRPRKTGGLANPGDAASLRARILDGETTFLEILKDQGLVLDAGALTYMGHWVTPVCEPRRYDTRFFAARIPEGESVVLNEAEMSEALWLTPADALERNLEGSLPLVFPTLRTLEELTSFATVEEALQAWGTRPVPRHLPRLVETDEGIGIELEE